MASLHEVHPMKSGTFSRRTLCALLALISAGVLRLAAQDVDPTLHDFRPNGDYVLTVKGQAVPGDILYSEHAGAMLILSSAFPSPVLLKQRAGTVETVSVMKVMKKADGTVDLLSGAVLAPQGQINLSGENVTFTADGKEGELRPKPPLLGLRSVWEVTAHNPEYKVGANNYTPNPQAISSLRKEARPVTVRVFYGSWCPHCRQMVPHAVKDEQQLKGSKINFEYFGVPQRFGTDPEAKRLGINAVPTGIVYISGKEIGRIESSAWESPESALVQILAEHSAAR
jgi:thiol-disulfide isomerase/thioredoxin